MNNRNELDKSKTNTFVDKLGTVIGMVTLSCIAICLAAICIALTCRFVSWLF